MSGESADVMPITSFEELVDSLGIPESCKLDKPVFKKMLLDTEVLDGADKTALKDDVEKIRWLYTLKPSTINIAPYSDDDKEYTEIAVLQVGLTSTKRQKRIATFFNKAIPYPLMLLFTFSKDGVEQFSLSLADKRVNQVDKEKWIVDQVLETEWVELSNKNSRQEQVSFVDSLKIEGIPFTCLLYTSDAADE